MAAEKRVVFRSSWLPWALVAPQAAIIGVFFFWPAGQTLVQAFQQSDAFGTSVEWVGLENFRNLFNDPTYLRAGRYRPTTDKCTLSIQNQRRQNSRSTRITP